jgi:hypothetical protein
MDDDLRSELRRTVARIAELLKRRDELIRRGRDADVDVADLARDAGLSVPRIYQIAGPRR